MDFGEMMLSKLKAKYTLTQNDLKENALLKKSGMKFALKSWEVQDLGHFFIMDMSGMMGLMKMETVILAAETKKVPLFNLDYVKAMGNETLMAEYYNVAEDTVPEPYAAAFDEIRSADASLEDYASGSHWYDPYLLPFTYRKKGKKQTAHFMDVAGKEIDLFLKLIDEAETCDPAQRKESTRFFAQSLLDQGGPAVDQFTKLFGRDTAEQVVREYMYGV